MNITFYRVSDEHLHHPVSCPVGTESYYVFPRRIGAMGTAGTVHFQAVNISEVRGAINQFFHIFF
jgi:hypothetical protein